MIIGLTVVALGSSLPELIVNLFATFKGVHGVAFGNVIGNNIANILLIMGIIPLIKPLIIPAFVELDISIMFFLRS